MASPDRPPEYCSTGDRPSIADAGEITAVVFATVAGGNCMLAGLSVLDRLTIHLFRAGASRILMITPAKVELVRARALGIRVEQLPALPELRGSLLVTQGNVLVSVSDLRRTLERSGRLVSNEGEAIPLGVVSGAYDWQAQLSKAPAVSAEGPAGVVADEPSRRRLERRYWASLTSKSDGWVDRHFNRPVGRWLSYALAESPITPNQVSVLSISMGLVAAALFAWGSWGTGVWGALWLQLSAIVDCVDGDLARAQCRESPLGKWLDIVGDQVVHLSVFLGLGIGLWRTGAPGPVVELGAVAAVGVILSFLVVLRALLRPEVRGSSRMQELIDATTNRDFSVLLIVFALGGVLSWFLWVAAVGSHLFWMLALALQMQDRTRN